MTSTTHMNMHSEHREWESEISAWRDDLRVWQQELAKTQGEMKQVEKSLEDHAEALRLHASTLRLQEQTFDIHEHAIVDYEKGGEGDELFEMARQHGEEAVSHNKHREAHDLLKQRHHNVIAHWNALLRAIREPTTASQPAKKAVAIQ